MTSVNPPPMAKIPRVWQENREIRYFWQGHGRFLLQLWERSGGAVPPVMISEYSATKTYSIDNVVLEGCCLWVSETNNNLGNTPSTDSGTNWLPAVDGGKIPEVITLEERSTTVVQHVGGGDLSAFRLNQIQDGSTYDLPLASSVSDGQIIIVSLPSEFSTSTPTIQVKGSDTITASIGSDTDLLIDTGMSTFRFMSDGLLDWSISA